jgi:hypothetical protein
MNQQTQSQALIHRELTRIGRPRTSPVHSGYAAIVAKTHALGLPQCYATDITIHDRLLIIRRQPRLFAWLLHRCGSLLSLPEPNGRPLTISTPRDGSTAMLCPSAGMAATSCRPRISIT